MTASAERSSSRAPALRFAAALAAVAVLALLGYQAGGALPAFVQWVDGLGVWGPLVFGAGYALAVVAFVPASLLTLVAGALFGVAKGTAVVFAAAVLGSCAAFLIARHLARAAIERRIAGDPRFAAVDRAIGAEGRKIVLLLRLSPAFPFIFLNYALGLTRVGFRDYLAASVGMLPGTLLYVYLGKVAGDVAKLASGYRPEGGTAGTLLLGVGLVATVLATALITRIARRALAEATGA